MDSLNHWDLFFLVICKQNHYSLFYLFVSVEMVAIALTILLIFIIITGAVLLLTIAFWRLGKFVICVV